MATTSKDTVDKSEARGVTDTARQVADTVAGVAGEVTARLPEAATTIVGVNLIERDSCKKL